MDAPIKHQSLVNEGTKRGGSPRVNAAVYWVYEP